MKSVTISGPVVRDTITETLIVDQFNTTEELCEYASKEAIDHSEGLKATWTDGSTDGWPTYTSQEEIELTKQANW